MSTFASRLLRWHAQHGRHDLPWSATRDPYAVWLSEIMLQQTQVATVLPYYARFMQRLPNVNALAAASQAEVLQLWAGLGYYARARHLHQCARELMAHHDGAFPQTVAQLQALPGIGRSTAAAIAAFCFNTRAAILDGNVKRVLARVFGIEGFPGTPAVERELWALAESLLPRQAQQMPAYTQALMDLGATLCTRRAPRCDACPLRNECVARREGRVDLLPTPRPPRVLKQQRVWWLLLLARKHVWLQRRPEKGLWGGLLVPPQFTSLADLRRALKSYGLEDHGARWPQRTHLFTHLRLEFVPYLLPLETLVALDGEGGREEGDREEGDREEGDREKGQWLPLKRAAHAELPTPVRQLLLDLLNQI